MRKLLVLVALVGACGNNASAPPLDAYDLGCGSDDTVTGGTLYSCAIKGAPGICTNDDHGVIQCYAECGPQLSCGPGTPYVLKLATQDVCYCMMP